jgi:hypothetical protein
VGFYAVRSAIKIGVEVKVLVNSLQLVLLQKQA